VQVRVANRADLEPYLDRSGYDLSSAFVDNALRSGHVCVFTQFRGELAAYGWVSYHPTAHLCGWWVDFDPGHRYNYKSLTLPEFRGHHLRGSYGVLKERDEAEGVTHSIAFIELHNTASIKAEERNGGRRVGYAGYLNLGRFSWSYRSPGARTYGFRFFRP
jgi:hypothetical protein